MKYAINNRGKALAVVALALASLAFATAQSQWDIPEAEAQALNPTPLTPENVEAGKLLYEKNCQSCHGNPGKGDNLAVLIPPPPDLGTAEFQEANTPGMIFHKVTNGMGTMPSFKLSIASDNERWYIVHYIRSFGDHPEDAEVAVEEAAKPAGSKIEMSVELGADSTLMARILTTDSTGAKVPAVGVEVSFFAKRYFGMLPIGEGAVKTNAQGLASVKFPSDLPGDSTGLVQVFVQVKDVDTYGKVEAEQAVQWGISTVPKNLLDDRTLWTIGWNAPLWLIITYAGILGIVFIILGVVALNVKKMKELGDNYNAKNP